MLPSEGTCCLACIVWDEAASKQVSGLVSLHVMHVMQIAAAEAAGRAEAQELEGWKRDSTAVLAALDSTLAEKITEVSHTNLFCELQLLLSNMTLLQ